MGWNSPPVSPSLIDFPISSRFAGPALPGTSSAVPDPTQLCVSLPPSIKWGLLIFFPECFGLSESTRKPYLFICLPHRNKLCWCYWAGCYRGTILRSASLPKPMETPQNVRSLRSSEISWGNQECDMLFKLNFFFRCLSCMLSLRCFASQIQ